MQFISSEYLSRRRNVVAQTCHLSGGVCSIFVVFEDQKPQAAKAVVYAPFLFLDVRKS